MAEKFVDTREQSIAQSFDRHISVTANAGSGKTTILKKRFINIALHHGTEFEPRRIVAITFTRKAAGEIFAKIAEEFEEMLKQKLSDTQHKILFSVRSNLRSANISTIHSFCSSLLRDFPIEAEVSPNFIELNEADKLKLINDAIVSVLSEKLTNPEFDNEKYRQLFRTFGRRNIENYIKNILGKMESYAKIKNVYLKDNQQFIDWIVDEYLTLFLTELKPLMKNLIDSSKAMEKYEHNNLLELMWKDITINFERIFDEIYSKENIDIEVLNLLISKIEYQKEFMISNKLMTMKFTVNRTSYPTKKFTISENIETGLVEFFKQLSKYEILSQRENLPVTLNYARTFIELTESVINYIDNEKESNNYLDFDDLLLKANLMLKNQETCDKIRKRFDYIMIDEFQDTNDIQYEIVKSLIPELIGTVTNNDINLFIVGDPKQSIYGFRNADVRVFNKAIDDINLVNNTLISNNIITDKIFNQDNLPVECNNSEILGNMELSISFRHRPVISAFTNYVCRNIMSSKESEYDVSYSDLICTKNVEEIQLLSDAERRKLSSEFGSVTFITSIENKDEENNEESESIVVEDNEYELLAKYLMNIVESSSDSKKYSYNDIAILGRTKSKFGLLTVAFQKYGIPYILQSGRGFYETQEVQDLLSVLKFLHNNMDDVALVATLRSPFFGISDELLTTLAYQYRGECYWIKIQKFLQDSENELLNRARNILLNLLEYSTKLSISHLLLQIIEMTAFDGAIVNVQGNTQIKANVDKLIQMAREFENRGFRNMYDFVEEVNFISSASTNESEAVILTDDDAVNIMTIHASKGLEFPIIALIDTMSGTGGNYGLIIDDKYGLGFKTPEYITANDSFENNNNLIYSIIKERDAKKEKAELKRLIYVA
jgi:ATP-dependent helicase/nuclease subunit A